MSSRADELPHFPIPTPEESAWLQYLNENPPRLTWDEYVKAVDEFSSMYPPNREVPSWPEPFEI